MKHLARFLLLAFMHALCPTQSNAAPGSGCDGRVRDSLCTIWDSLSDTSRIYVYLGYEAFDAFCPDKNSPEYNEDSCIAFINDTIAKHCARIKPEALRIITSYELYDTANPSVRLDSTAWDTYGCGSVPAIIEKQELIKILQEPYPFITQVWLVYYPDPIISVSWPGLKRPSYTNSVRATIAVRPARGARSHQVRVIEPNGSISDMRGRILRP